MIRKPMTNCLLSVPTSLFLGRNKNSFRIGLARCLHACLVSVFLFFFSPPLCRQNGKKKLPSFFGIDGGGERDTTADKILQYIPGKASSNASCPLPRVYSHPSQGQMCAKKGPETGCQQVQSPTHHPGAEPPASPSSITDSSGSLKRARGEPPCPKNSRAGCGVRRARQAARWEHPPTPLLLSFCGSLLLGRPVEEGKRRASARR